MTIVAERVGANPGRRPRALRRIGDLIPEETKAAMYALAGARREGRRRARRRKSSARR